MMPGIIVCPIVQQHGVASGSILYHVLVSYFVMRGNTYKCVAAKTSWRATYIWPIESLVFPSWPSAAQSSNHDAVRALSASGGNSGVNRRSPNNFAEIPSFDIFVVDWL